MKLPGNVFDLAVEQIMRGGSSVTALSMFLSLGKKGRSGVVTPSGGATEGETSNFLPINFHSKYGRELFFTQNTVGWIAELILCKRRN